MNKMDKQNPKKKALFICEAITFAHITRMYTLASYLNIENYEIHFACSSFPEMVFKGSIFKKYNIYSISSKEFMEALAKGRVTHSYDTLKRYVQDDLHLIDIVKPDVIIGDFRLSLAVSARISEITYINITNAYWSPYHTLKKLPTIDHPLFNSMGELVGSVVFNNTMNLISKMLIQPYNQLHRYYGFKTYSSLTDTYTDGDIVLYCDISELVPTFNLPETHSYMGPVFWVPDLIIPKWGNELKDKPVVFLSMGSSGDVKLMPAIIEKLSQMSISLVVATA
jgi:UDP:flavonoid glycosyltransferase YjiC (YdhE family)